MNSPAAVRWTFVASILSLALNVVLASTLFRANHSSVSKTILSGPGTTDHAGQQPLWKPARRRTAVVYVTNDSAATPLRWADLESRDYKQYAARLRAAGVPEQVVRDIIMADVGKLFGARAAAIRGVEAPRPWWQKYKNEKQSPEQMERFKALDRERTALLNEVLGEPISSQQLIDELYLQDRLNEGHLAFLPADKREAARSALRAAEQQRMQRALEEEEERDWNKRQRADEKERVAELNKVLSPEEVEEFLLRTGTQASSLRNQIAEFETTPDEFRAILKAKQEAEEAAPRSRDQAERQKREAELLKALFGPERYAEYERATDLSWRNAVQIADEQGLPRDAANRVFDAKKAADAEIARIHADKSIATAEREAQVNALKAQSEQAVRAALGEAGFKSYRRQGGFWMQNLR